MLQSGGFFGETLIDYNDSAGGQGAKAGDAQALSENIQYWTVWESRSAFRRGLS